MIPFLWRALTGEGTGASLDILGAVLVAGTAAGLVLLVQSPSTGLPVAVVGVAADGARRARGRAAGTPPTARLPAGRR